MKVRLLDLFWLILLGATLTVWTIEHRRAAKEIASCRLHRIFLNVDRGGAPSSAELRRLSALAAVSKLSDEELDGLLDPQRRGTRFQAAPEYEASLSEMARRELVDPLQKRYDAMMAQGRDQTGYEFPDNLELLTALRRAQRLPDPLSISVSLDRRPRFPGDASAPRLQATIENVDSNSEPVRLEQGGDYRGGRAEKWRFIMTDTRGQKVADSNFGSFGMGGGLCSIGPLTFGDTASSFFHFDLRCYVAPPPSGRYQLQAVYHNSVDIGSQRDIAGLIVSTSEPISVIVDNPALATVEQKRKENRRPLSVLAFCAALTFMSILSRAWPTRSPRNARLGHQSFISRRDLCWTALIVTLAIGMWLDQRRQSQQIFDIRPDAAAEWSIRLADEPQP